MLETDKRLQCLIEFIVGKFDIEMPERLKEDYIIYKDDGRNVFFDLSARDRQDILRTKMDNKLKNKLKTKTEFRVCRKTVHTFLYTTVYDLLN